MAMTQITNENRDDALNAARAWAGKNQAEITEQVDQWTGDVSLMMAAGDWGVEFLPQNGWAYLHGFGTLNGIGTNIVNIEEINDGIDRLLAKIN